MNDALSLINQFGLPLVLFVGLAYAYARQTKEHAEERKAWEAEKNRLYELAMTAQAERIEDSEKFAERIIKAQEATTSVVNKTSEIAAQYERERRQIREDRDQELRRATGSHAPSREHR